MMYSKVNLSALEGALKDAVVEMIDEKVETMDTPIGYSKKASTVGMAEKFEEVLGIRAEKLEFCWEAKKQYDFYKISFTIGLTKVYITKGKSFRTVIDEILAAVRDELAGKETEILCRSLCEKGYGVMFEHDENLLEKASIHELIQYLNNDRYCDEAFVEWVRSMGLEVKTGMHSELDEIQYIDVSQIREGAKIWLWEANKQHTLYRSAAPRCRLEVMYLLHALVSGEQLLSDEY